MKREDEILEPETAAPEPAPAEPLSPATELETLKRERDELKDQVLRRRAEFENFRKRVERDKLAAALDAEAALLTGLLPSLDNLEKALAAAVDGTTLREGVQLIHRNLVAFLESQGVVIVDPTGQKFDPQLHQALSHEPAPGHAEGTVVETYGKAYLYKDRLLRPALVKVAKGGASNPEITH